MKPIHPGILLIASLFAVIGACGGGAGGIAGLSPSPPTGGGGIGGTGLTTSGTIDGTGSILVNGVRFDVSDADIRIDGEPATEADLGPGMVVTVRGTLDDDDAAEATAEEVDYERDLIGPVDSIEIGTDGSSMRLRILDRSVIAERVNTVFSGLDFDTIALDDRVDVSGFTDEQNRIRATRIALNTDSIAGQNDVKLRATVSQLAGTEFRAGDRLVRAGNATLVNLPGGALANGQQVEVTGTLAGSIITANRITLVGSLADNLQSGDELRVQGTITNFVSRGDFRVRDIPVNAGDAELDLAGGTLREGLVVEIEGPWNGSALDAERVRARRGRTRAEARLGDIDAAAGTLTLQFVYGSVTLTTDERTLFTGDDDDDFLSIGALRTGDFLVAEAIRDGNTLLATRVRREDEEDDEVLQGPVDSLVSGVSVTLLGVRFETTGAEFETIDNVEVDATTFYNSLGVGDLVRVEDDEPADGIADEVEFESATNLDGDIEFPEDDSDDDDSGDDSLDDDGDDTPDADDDGDVSEEDSNEEGVDDPEDDSLEDEVTDDNEDTLDDGAGDDTLDDGVDDDLPDADDMSDDDLDDPDDDDDDDDGIEE